MSRSNSGNPTLPGVAVSSSRYVSTADSLSSVTLRGKSGANVINVNDLLTTDAFGNLYSVGVSDCAAVSQVGGTIIPSTSVSGFAGAGNFNYRKSLFVNSTDGTVIMGGPQASPDTGLIVNKYSPSGLLLVSTVVDTAAFQTTDCSIVKLSNDSIAVTWANNSVQYFAILDAALNIIIAKTSTGLIGGASAGYLPDILALSGGGFVISGQLNNGGSTSFIIYTNAGGVTQALTSVTGGPTASTGVYSKLAQLANGNFVIAISAIAAGKYLGFAIYSAAGASVVAYTASNTTSSTVALPPEISVIGSTFCISWLDDTNATAYVYNASGALQGSRYFSAFGVPTSAGQKLLNDGTAFWFLFGISTTTAVYIPVTGSNFSSAKLSNSFGNLSDAFFGRSMIVIGRLTNALAFFVDPNLHTVSLVSTTTLPFSVRQLCQTFDGAFVAASSTNFAAMKFQNTAIVGVAQQSVAAGNPGTSLNYSSGPGLYPINQIYGNSGKGFSSGVVMGNAGVMLGSSVALRGMNRTPRDIN